jgi:phage-related protein
MTENNELSAYDIGAISKWLFGQKSYQKLKILQGDMETIIFYCFFTDGEVVRVGNIIRGIKAKVHCRDAWGLTESKTIDLNPSPWPITTLLGARIDTDNKGWTYPTLVITVDSFGGDCEIVWRKYPDERITLFTGLSANEVLTIDNNLQIITSSTGLNRLPNFNKNFFRVNQGYNSLQLTGHFAQCSIIYQSARNIG